MSNTKKQPAKMEDIQAVLQALIAQGKKDGMLRASELNAQLEKLDLSPEKIEEIYDRFEAMNIQILGAELELDDDLEILMSDDLGDDMDLSGMEEEELVDPVDLAAEYNDIVRADFLCLLGSHNSLLISNIAISKANTRGDG